MGKLREYRAVALAGLAVLVFLAAAYLWVGNAGKTESRYTYAEHIFRAGVVNELDIQIAEADWQDMLENPMEEEYHRADIVINGETVGKAAIRTKGNTSLTFVASTDSDRYSFKLDFDYYEGGGNYYGLKKLNLNNNYSDSSSMREYISYRILDAMGVPTPGCGYTHITVNGEEWGLYLAVEAVDEVFLETHFGNASGVLYKPDGIGADLVYRGDDISLYTGRNPKTKETDGGSAVLALMRALESGEGLEETLDVDEALRYLAVNVALANFDSYLGGTTHNFYLYEQDGVFSVLPWDYNLSFGGMGGGKVDIYNPVSSGMGGPGGGGFPQEREGMARPEMGEIARPGQDAAFGGDRPRMEMPEGMSAGRMSGEKPLVGTLLADEKYLAAYEGCLREMAEVYLSEEYLAALITEVHDLIAPYVQRDATAFYTYAEFERACSTDPEDEYSLVYFGVNMAESIRNQLAGGEPTFDSSSLKDGGMGGRQDRPQGDAGAEGRPVFGGGERAERGKMRGGAPGMPRMEDKRRADLPALAACGGVCAAGLVFALRFRRKRELVPPKE